MNRLGLMTLSGGMVLVALAGCDPTQTVQLRYDRPAQFEIGPSIRTLGIAEFGGKTTDDRRWGDIASDRLAAELDTYNKKFQRYQLVDRKRLKAVLDEQDLQAAFSDSAKAVEAGKIAHVDAMIYGSVTVSTRDEQATRTVLDPLQRTTKTVTYTKRYVMAAVNFTIDSIQTSKTLATVATMREFDSEKQSTDGGVQSMVKALGFGGDKLPPTDQLLSHLIDECVLEFVAKISPHQVTVTERLRPGKSQAVRTGNTLAAAGDYAEALQAYESAIAENPADHEAVFDAGVMQEAVGKLDQAEKYYDRAFKLRPELQYVQARKRVRLESGQ
jgi:tetratricopeptide (TPR) repeat protein